MSSLSAAPFTSANPNGSDHITGERPATEPSSEKQAVEERPIGRFRVIADAAARGLHVEVRSRPAADGLVQAAELLGVAPSAIVKSLVVKRHDGDYLFVLVPGDRQISWSKLRAAVSVNRLSLPHESKAFDATGYVRGTITPLGSSTAWPVYADERILGGRVAMGGGEHGYSAFVDADALVSAFDAVVADLTEPIVER
jgi:Cys-tRNA(Pro)/Cys-tRNA(Cys) deacylase